MGKVVLSLGLGMKEVIVTMPGYVMRHVVFSL
jgi:hypothetical protein